MAPGRVLVGMVLSLIAGMVAEIIDRVAQLTQDPYFDAHGVEITPPTDWVRYYILGAVLGLLIGLALGITEGLYSGSRTRFWRAALFGALGGGLCGLIALHGGSILYAMLGGNPTSAAIQTTVGFLHQIFARSLGWALMGMLLGAVGGVPQL